MSGGVVDGDHQVTRETHSVLQVLGTLRIIDKTLIDVHTMLVAVVKSLVEGGQTGVFTPMYMLCFEKPVSK